ncbi:MAG: histidine kinase [Myxococcota bacterium]
MAASLALPADTLRALLLPRRLVPVLVVSVPLVIAQASFSHDPMAGPVGVAMCIAFWLFAPLAWRWLFPARPRSEPQAPAALRLLGYVALSTWIVVLIGYLVPRALNMPVTLLTDRWSLAIAGAMFIVGGWGLGRDIELESQLTKERQRAKEAREAAERAELLAIRSHLDPHFLFNTLNAIAEWCRQDGEVAERATLQLSSMLRTILDGVRTSEWPLAQEIELCRTLLSLHLIRDPEWFRVDATIDETVSTNVPPLILLPLVENAVKHGPAKGHRGPLRLEVRATDDRVEVIVENPGPYLGPWPGGDGLRMVERRLSLGYRGAAHFNIEDLEGRTRATVGLPRNNPEVNT